MSLDCHELAMQDQAGGLRRLVRQLAAQGTAPPSAVRPRQVTVIGGQDQVGVTTVALHLAIALARRRCRPVLVEGDSPTANTTRIGPTGKLLQWDAPADWVVLDAGGSNGRAAQPWCRSADLILVVTTPELPSVVGAYERIKALATSHYLPPIHALVNMAASPAVAGEVYARLRRACLRLLGLRLHDAGYLPRAVEVPESPRRGELSMRAVSDGLALPHLTRLADRLTVTLSQEEGRKQKTTQND
jgi:MinD-like ATPase involved in chromosome partitioning or flagellar assembly